jgi:hypothetical protein
MTTYTPEVRRPSLDLSKPLKSWLVRRVWQNAPTANEPRSDGLLQKKPWTSNLGHLVGAGQQGHNNRVFGNSYPKKDISEGQGFFVNVGAGQAVYKSETESKQRKKR